MILIIQVLAAVAQVEVARDKPAAVDQIILPCRVLRECRFR
jgi:hypothetical protein